jgi:hypothetical protein
LPKGNGRNFYWKDDDGVYHDIIIDSDWHLSMMKPDLSLKKSRWRKDL